MTWKACAACGSASCRVGFWRAAIVSRQRLGRPLGETEALLASAQKVCEARQGRQAPPEPQETLPPLPAGPPPAVTMHGATAREKFAKGMRVRLSALGFERNISCHRQTGIVVGFSRDGTCVYVVRDGGGGGQGTAFHVSFWEPEEQTP